MPVNLSFMDDHFVNAQINSRLFPWFDPVRSCHLSHITYATSHSTQCLPFQIGTPTLCSIAYARMPQLPTMPNRVLSQIARRRLWSERRYCGARGKCFAKLQNKCDLSISVREQEPLFPSRSQVVINSAHRHSSESEMSSLYQAPRLLSSSM